MDELEIRDEQALATSELSAENKKILDQEAISILNKLVVETDTNKAKDLTYLFNLNQNKKTMARVNKMNELLDLLAEQTMKRFSKRPDEVTTQELLQGLKVVQEIMERGQKTATGMTEQPLIQINQQTNEFNMGASSMSKESRDKVKEAVLAILSGATESKEAPVVEVENVESNVVNEVVENGNN